MASLLSLKEFLPTFELKIEATIGSKITEVAIESGFGNQFGLYAQKN